MDEPVGDHQAVAVGQGQHRRQVGLEAAGEQQRPVSPQPGRQLRLQLHVHRPGAGDQPRGPGTHAIAGGGCLGGGNDVRVAAQAEIVVAGEVEEGGALISNISFKARLDATLQYPDTANTSGSRGSQAKFE